MAKRSRPMVSSVVVALLMGCLVSPENAPNTQVTQDVFSTDGYLIGAEDVLEISVWQNQDLSRTVTVRPDGVISLPLVGDVQAAGMTPQALKIEIGRKLVPYMDAPNVAVIVQQINSWRIYVQGEVRSPGVYPIRSQVALSQAITMAGGLTEFAKTSRIRVVRRTKKRTEVIQINYNHVIKGREDANNLLLMPGDTVIVP